MAATDIGTLITRSPDIRGGRPRIAGTGVTVRRIAVLYTQGATAEEIAERIGHLTPAQVHAALAYYYANRDEVDADLAREGEEYDQLADGVAATPSLPAAPPHPATRRRAQHSRAALRAAFGGWRDVDTDRLVDDIYADRLADSRPAVSL